MDEKIKAELCKKTPRQIEIALKVAKWEREKEETSLNDRKLNGESQ